MFLTCKFSIQMTAWFLLVSVLKLVQEVVAAIGNADVELGNASLLLLPVLRILDHPGQFALHPGFLVCNTAVGVQGRELTIREGRKRGNTQVDTNLSRGRMHGLWHIYLGLESDVPVVSLPGDGRFLTCLPPHGVARRRPSLSWVGRPCAHPP